MTTTENQTQSGAALPDRDLLSVLEAAAYNLWMAALQGNTPNTQALCHRMKNPQVGDMVMEISSYRRINGDRQGTGTLIAVEENENTFGKKWTIRTPSSDTCNWTNADFIAIPIEAHVWFRSPNRMGAETQMPETIHPSNAIL